MDVFRSVNAPVPLGVVPAVFPERLTCLVYTGPLKLMAVVVWGVRLQVVTNFGSVSVTLSVVGVAAGVKRPESSFLVVGGVVGDLYDFGGVLVIDLVPGMLLELVGYAGVINLLVVQSNGFSVVVR